VTEAPLLLRMGEVAELLQVSRATVYRMAADGELPVVSIRGKLRVPRRALEAWLAELGGDAPGPVHLTPITHEDAARGQRAASGEHRGSITTIPRR
jgi:excisionase family DNA binding protein